MTTTPTPTRTRTPLRTEIGPARIALLVATVLVGLAAGFFYTYEASVTLGLAEVDDVTYVETFQAVNDTIRNPAFGIVFFGSGVAVVAALILNWNATNPLVRRSTLVAAGLFVGTFLLTFAGNVPLNDELGALVDVSPTAAAEARADFEDEWNRLNLFRALSMVASFVALAVALVFSSPANDQTG